MKFKSANDAYEYLYGVDDGAIDVGEYDEIEIIFHTKKVTK